MPLIFAIEPFEKGETTRNRQNLSRKGPFSETNCDSFVKIMLGEVEKTMIEQTRDALKEAISHFPLDACLKSVVSNADILKMRAEMERLRGGLTPHEPLFEFCGVVIDYCDEQMAMTRLLEGSIRGMNSAQKKLLRQIDDILEENKKKWLMDFTQEILLRTF